MVNHCHLATKTSACCPFSAPPELIGDTHTHSNMCIRVTHTHTQYGCIITVSEAALRNNYRGWLLLLFLTNKPVHKQDGGVGGRSSHLCDDGVIRRQSLIRICPLLVLLRGPPAQSAVPTSPPLSAFFSFSSFLLSFQSFSRPPPHTHTRLAHPPHPPHPPHTHTRCPGSHLHRR